MYPYLVTNPFDQNLGGKFWVVRACPFCFNQQMFCNSFVLLLLMFLVFVLPLWPLIHLYRPVDLAGRWVGVFKLKCLEQRKFSAGGCNGLEI